MKRRVLTLAIAAAATSVACTGAPVGPTTITAAETTATPSQTSRSTALEPPEYLSIAGAIDATTSDELVGSGHGCALQSGNLSFLSNAMKVAGDSRVVRVSIELKGVDGIGRYSATLPLQRYRRTPVSVAVAANAATGGGHFYVATAAHVDVDALGADGSARGTYGFVRAQLKAQPGPGTIRLRGTWIC